jgi:hypothetical protein
MKESKMMRDEQKTKDELIEELLALRQRVAELEEAEAQGLGGTLRGSDVRVDLPAGLVRVRTLKGLLPICASCKKIRDDQGYWNHLEMYIREHSEAEFSHGLCPECVKKLYPVDILTIDPDGNDGNGAKRK